jgi:hypothetical protein
MIYDINNTIRKIHSATVHGDIQSPLYTGDINV